ncbi:hypothetical protein V499_00814 [Pseudogymnoascus sp. VKM F-103]|nr:hypothetical protein V499_00814 [Pseudogymnoascus sp. VKM F-103]
MALNGKETYVYVESSSEEFLLPHNVSYQQLLPLPQQSHPPNSDDIPYHTTLRCEAPEKECRQGGADGALAVTVVAESGKRLLSLKYPKKEDATIPGQDNTVGYSSIAGIEPFAKRQSYRAVLRQRRGEGALQQSGEIDSANEEECADGHPEALGESLVGGGARGQANQRAVAGGGVCMFVWEADQVESEEGGDDE